MAGVAGRCAPQHTLLPRPHCSQCLTWRAGAAPWATLCAKRAQLEDFKLHASFKLTGQTMGSATMAATVAQIRLEMPWAGELAGLWDAIPSPIKLAGHCLFCAGLAPEFKGQWLVHYWVRRARAKWRKRQLAAAGCPCRAPGCAHAHREGCKTLGGRLLLAVDHRAAPRPAAPGSGTRIPPPPPKRCLRRSNRRRAPPNPP